MDLSRDNIHRMQFPLASKSKIVHLDLKGAPPKLIYLEKSLELFKKWGATGILVEWEDTFPYSGGLVDIGSVVNAGGDGMYTMEEVIKIFNKAKDVDLEVIQLVQTMGHMEFVLKHPVFADIREQPMVPNILCPSKEKSKAVVQGMLDQILAVQPDAKYLHIGADEVWHLGVCADCSERARNHRHGASGLYLEHIRSIAIYLRQIRPNMTILMWDDMLRSLPSETIKEYLGSLVVPTVWDYNEKVHFKLPPDLWRKYNEVFPSVWAASAFKGAASSCQILVPTQRYLNNQDAWISEIANNLHVNFDGIILTGWSRFDHYATYCELLPVAMPSLAACLKRYSDDTQLYKYDVDSLPLEEWPGYEVAVAIRDIAVEKQNCMQFLQSDLLLTYLNTWQCENGHTNPLQVQALVNTTHVLLRSWARAEAAARAALGALAGARLAAEWSAARAAPARRLRDVLARAPAPAPAPPQ